MLYTRYISSSLTGPERRINLKMPGASGNHVISNPTSTGTRVRFKNPPLVICAMAVIARPSRSEGSTAFT
jgi:hypothetical protein